MSSCPGPYSWCHRETRKRQSPPSGHSYGHQWWISDPSPTLDCASEMPLNRWPLSQTEASCILTIIIDSMTVLCYSVKGQLSSQLSDPPPCFLHAWPRILYEVIKTLAHSWAVSWDVPSKGLPTHQPSQAVWAGNVQPDRRGVGTMKALWKRARSSVPPPLTSAIHWHLNWNAAITHQP